MKLLEDLGHIVRHIESILDITLTEEDFADGRPEIIHVFLLEECLRLYPDVHHGYKI